MGAKGQGKFSQHIGFRIPTDHVKALRKLAKVEGVKDSKVYRRAMESFLVSKGLVKKAVKKIVAKKGK